MAVIMHKRPGFYVKIVETATGKVHREMGPHSERKADKIADGASINLDHERFHVDVVEVK